MWPRAKAGPGAAGAQAARSERGWCPARAARSERSKGQTEPNVEDHPRPQGGKGPLKDAPEGADLRGRAPASATAEDTPGKQRSATAGRQCHTQPLGRAAGDTVP